MKKAARYLTRCGIWPSFRTTSDAASLRAARFLFATALLMVLGGCQHLVRHEVETCRVPAPGRSGSFGDVGVYVAVDELARETADLSVPIPAEELRWFPESAVSGTGTNLSSPIRTCPSF